MKSLKQSREKADVRKKKPHRAMNSNGICAGAANGFTLQYTGISSLKNHQLKTIKRQNSSSLI